MPDYSQTTRLFVGKDLLRAPPGDEFLRAVERAVARHFEVLGEVGRRANGEIVYLARETASRHLVALRLVPGEGGAEAGDYYLTVLRKLEGNAPTESKCPRCGDTIQGWGRFCSQCGADLSVVGPGSPGASRDKLVEAVKQAVGSEYELLGEMERSEGGGIVYFAKERASGKIVALRLQKDTPAVGGREHYNLGQTMIIDSVMNSLLGPVPATPTKTDVPVVTLGEPPPPIRAPTAPLRRPAGGYDVEFTSAGPPPPDSSPAPAPELRNVRWGAGPQVRSNVPIEPEAAPAGVGQEGRRAQRPAPCLGMYRVWFGTNRRPLGGRGKVLDFGGERDNVVHYGTCDVYVPRSHRIGSLGSPWWKRLLARTDDRLKLRLTRELAADVFWGALSQAYRRVPETDRLAVVFIHGFNVSFTEAALRAAQMGSDLQVRGAMGFFSWPSKGTLEGYLADSAAIEASEGAITQFLRDFAARCGAEHVHVIAHSMGNRGLLRAVQRMVREAEATSGARFGHFVLAAPDVDVDLFRELAAWFADVVDRTTLYVSDRDLALDASSWVHQFPRAGYAPPVMVVPWVDTVYVANVDLTVLGHGYVAEARDVLHDIYSLLHYRAHPARRMGLRPAKTPEGDFYWIISA